MKRLRLSYSILNAWSEGKKKDAIEMATGIEKDNSDNYFIKQGKDFHTAWEREIKITGKLPRVFSTENELVDPKTEVKMVVDVEEFTFVGVIDCLDFDTIYEFKTGIKEEFNYTSGIQGLFYAALYERLHEEKIARVVYYKYCYNTCKRFEYEIQANTEDKKWALDWGLKNAREIYKRLEKEGKLDLCRYTEDENENS